MALPNIKQYEARDVSISKLLDLPCKNNTWLMFRKLYEQNKTYYVHINKLPNESEWHFLYITNKREPIE